MTAKLYKKLFYSTSILALSAFSPTVSQAEQLSIVSNTAYNSEIAALTIAGSISTSNTTTNDSKLPVTLSANTLPYSTSAGVVTLVPAISSLETLTLGTTKTVNISDLTNQTLSLGSLQLSDSSAVNLVASGTLNLATSKISDIIEVGKNYTIADASLAAIPEIDNSYTLSFVPVTTTNSLEIVAADNITIPANPTTNVTNIASNIAAVETVSFSTAETIFATEPLYIIDPNIPTITGSSPVTDFANSQLKPTVHLAPGAKINFANGGSIINSGNTTLVINPDLINNPSPDQIDLSTLNIDSIANNITTEINLSNILSVNEGYTEIPINFNETVILPQIKLAPSALDIIQLKPLELVASLDEEITKISSASNSMYNPAEQNTNSEVAYTSPLISIGTAANSTETPTTYNYTDLADLYTSNNNTVTAYSMTFEPLQNINSNIKTPNSVTIAINVGEDTTIINPEDLNKNKLTLIESAAEQTHANNVPENNINDDSYILSFVLSNAEEPINITSTRINTFASAGSDSTVEYIGTALDSIAENGTSDQALDQLVARLNSMQTAEEVNAALEILKTELVKNLASSGSEGLPDQSVLETKSLEEIRAALSAIANNGSLALSTPPTLEIQSVNLSVPAQITVKTFDISSIQLPALNNTEDNNTSNDTPVVKTAAARQVIKTNSGINILQTSNLNQVSTISVTGTGNITGQLLDSSSGKINIGDSVTITSGSDITASYTSVLDISKEINIIAHNSNKLSHAGTYTISADTITASNKSVKIVDNSYIYQYSLEPNASGDVVITAVKANNFATAASAENINIGHALDELATDTTANNNIGLLLTQLGTLKEQAEVNSALEYLKPSDITATTTAVLSTQNQSLGIISSRLADVRNIASGNSGIATGGEALDKSVWGQIFGSNATQGYRSGIAGYESDMWGMALGADKDLFKDVNIGVSFSYAATSVDSLKGQTDIDSYQGTVYGSYDQSKWYAEAMIGVGANDYNNKRNIVIGSLANVASADYEGMQYTAKISSGYKLPSVSGFNITPIASLQYTLLHQDGYTETGSTSNLVVGNNDTNNLQSGLGTKVSREFNFGNYKISPEVRAMWLYDFVANDQTTSSSLADAPSVSFTSSGVKPARNMLDLGFATQLLAGDQVTISADYDYQAKKDYNSHAGSVNVKYKF